MHSPSYLRKLERILVSIALSCQSGKDLTLNGLSLNLSRAMDPSLDRENQFFILQGYNDHGVSIADS